MDERHREQAEEWFVRGDHDLETAQLILDHEGHTHVLAAHIQQAVEKYLKGYLVLHGEKPPRVHDLDTLLNLAARFDGALYAPFIDLCEKATRYYVEDRYPPGPPRTYPREQLKGDLDQARDLVRHIRSRVGA